MLDVEEHFLANAKLLHRNEITQGNSRAKPKESLIPAPNY